MIHYKILVNADYPQISVSDDENYANLLQEEECKCINYFFISLFT